MKAKYTLLAMALTVSATALAQEVDDMYFNAKDRLSLTESNQATLASRYAVKDQQAVQSNPVNPSDSYTGRGVNPEFSAQQKNGAELVQENPDYFLSSYTPKNVNGSLYSGSTASSNCGCGYSNPNSSSYSGYGNPYGGLYSPYGYSPYGGLTTSIGYGFGSYGSAMSIGMGYGMGSMYNPYRYGMYNPYGYSGYGYGSAYSPAVYSPDPIQTSHGKRPVRASSVNSQIPSATTGAFVAGTHGRTRGTSQSNYYDPSWRNNPSNFPTRSYDYGGRTTGYSSGSTTGRSWNGDSGRTRSFDSFGSGSRSSVGTSGSGFSGGSSSSGGRSRGRN